MPIDRASRIVSHSICSICKKSYILTSEDITIIPGMRVNPPSKHGPKASLMTWADWIDHCNIYCQECRIIRPPAACQRDLQAQLDKYMKNKRETDVVDAAYASSDGIVKA